MQLISGGPGTLGYNLDVFGASAIYIVVGLMATMIIFSNNSLEKKFTLVALPLATLFLGIVMGLIVRTMQSQNKL
jgi:hypothetical protein